MNAAFFINEFKKNHFSYFFIPVTARERTNSLTPAVPRPNTTLPLNWVLPPRTKSSADNDMPHALTPPKK